MKKAITSFGVGYHSRLLALSAPTFYLYANNHNYDFFIPGNNFFTEETKQRHPAWWKLDVIEYLLNVYDQVLWLDADVIICKFDIDIVNTIDTNNMDFGVVVHETPDGQIPNCGVWLLNKSALNWLPQLRQHNSFARSQCWWEQAALLHIMGMNPDDQPITLPDSYNLPWKQLDYLWNPHINDNRKIPQETRFFHATCFNDRYAVMKNILHQIDF